MSKKENKKNANKSLKALKRKQYARGGRTNGPVKALPKKRDLFDDSVKGPTPKPKPKTPAPYDDSNIKPKPKPAPNPSPKPKPIALPPRKKSVEPSGGTRTPPPSGGPQDVVTYTGLDGNEYSTNAELEAANAAYQQAQVPDPTVEPVTSGTTGSVTPPESNGKPPIGIEIKGPQATLRQMEAVGIDRTMTETADENIQKLEDATDATSGTVTAGAMTAKKGKASQAEVSGVDSEADQYADKYIEQYPEWNTVQKNQAREWAYSQRSGGPKKPMPSWLMDSDFLKGLEAANKMTYNTTERSATTYDAETAGALDPTKAAEGKVSETGVASQATATEADKTKRDDAAEALALGVVKDRPAYKDYAKGALSLIHI